MNDEPSNITYAILEGFPDRVVALRGAADVVRLPVPALMSPVSYKDIFIDKATGEFRVPEDTTAIPLTTFRRTAATMMSGGRNCVIFMRELAKR